MVILFLMLADYADSVDSKLKKLNRIDFSG